MQFQEFAPDVFGVWKTAGQTPLQALEEFQKTRPDLKGKKFTYAGRLDPMAEGLLLLLGPATTNRKTDFLKLNKIYEATVLFGFSTDSFDLLGIPKYDTESHKIDKETVQAELQNFQGEVNLTLPIFSSPPISGKPLWVHAKAGQIQTHEIPQRTTTIFKIDKIEFINLTSVEILTKVTNTIPKIRGDFRQAEIMTAWEKILTGLKQNFQAVSFRVHCSSGTYIRSLANELGKRMGTPTVLYGLKRTKIGHFEIKPPLT